MIEYVVRIERRDSRRPLLADEILSYGCDRDDPRRFAETLGAFVELLRIHGTPENVAEQMRRQQAVANAKVLLTR